jgi:hypothetical protein
MRILRQADPMGMGDDMGGGGDPSAAVPAPVPAAPEGQNAEGPTSIFISKEALGGKTVKEGDQGTITIKSVDPETGDAEATVEIGGGSMGDEGGIDAAFDKAMPPEPSEGTY